MYVCTPHIALETAKKKYKYSYIGVYSFPIPHRLNGKRTICASIPREGKSQLYKLYRYGVGKPYRKRYYIIYVELDEHNIVERLTWHYDTLLCLHTYNLYTTRCSKCI